MENILTDIATLGITYDRLTYTSDYFDALLQQAELLIKAGVLYADDTPVEQMREERMAMKESARRGRTVEENLEVLGILPPPPSPPRMLCMHAEAGMLHARILTVCPPWVCVPGRYGGRW